MQTKQVLALVYWVLWLVFWVLFILDMFTRHPYFSDAFGWGALLGLGLIIIILNRVLGKLSKKHTD
ncbi:hypothetical protein EQG49_00460 [Periweissella cryptocerci]|uniref:Uncharacterized protein n=1 Tax=Periweissella cryptocerci TaxID=2506420 RepID=A0A4P6YR03_9LACO|nr:hypothetical protein [Periweissella cryptocerci]QBO35026.1 hypothetical protein EQG49_00460 [Periweissella cryptocerci]